jgi:hypothetical protein
MMVRHTGCTIQTPETIIMNKRTSLLSMLLLIVTVSVSAQTLPARPASAPASQAESSELESKKKEERSALRLPYGTGFENRQQGMAPGGGGRGGMGRRR